MKGKKNFSDIREKVEYISISFMNPDSYSYRSLNPIPCRLTGGVIWVSIQNHHNVPSIGNRIETYHPYQRQSFFHQMPPYKCEQEEKVDSLEWIMIVLYSFFYLVESITADWYDRNDFLNKEIDKYTVQQLFWISLFGRVNQHLNHYQKNKRTQTTQFFDILECHTIYLYSLYEWWNAQFKFNH